MSNVEQLARIGLYSLGGYLFGDAVASSADYQAAVGGLLSIASFAWWAFRNYKK